MSPNKSLISIREIKKFLKNNYNIERAIVGIDSLDQLKSIYSAYVSNRNLYPKNFYSNDIYLIDPRKWNL